jgi:hypothetical protein
MRLAEVWMDEFAEYYYIREPAIRSLDYGDVSAQKKLREKLQCKSLLMMFYKNFHHHREMLSGEKYVEENFVRENDCFFSSVKMLNIQFV